MLGLRQLVFSGAAMGTYRDALHHAAWRMFEDVDWLTTLLVENERFAVLAPADHYAVSFSEDHRLRKAGVCLSRRVHGDGSARRQLMQTEPIGVVNKRDVFAFVDACVRSVCGQFISDFHASIDALHDIRQLCMLRRLLAGITFQCVPPIIRIC